MATAGSGTFGPVSSKRFSEVRSGSFTVTRGMGVEGFAILPKYLSTHWSSCCCSKSPTTMRTALSGR